MKLSRVVMQIFMCGNIGIVCQSQIASNAHRAPAR